MSARPRTSRSASPPTRGRPATTPHRAHDRRHGDDRVRLHQDRDRGAAARGQPDQAPAPALQRAAARRQVVSLYPDHRRPLGAADPQASRRAHAARALLRAVRLGRRGQPHHHRAAARVPVALVLRRLLREPHAGLACSTRSSAARAPCTGEIDFRRLYRTGARGRRVSFRPQPSVQKELARRDGEGVGGARFRARRGLSRPAWRRCRRSSRSRASIRAASRRRTSSPCTRRAATPASRCSSSAPDRTGATAPISRKPTARSARARCWARSWRSSTTTSRRRGSCWCRTISRSAGCWPKRSAPRPAARSRSRCRGAARRRNWSSTRSPMRARRWRASSPTPRRSRSC